MKTKIRAGQMTMTADTLAYMVGGSLISRNAHIPSAVAGLCTDSREVDGQTMLCAIRGERVDGHSFIPNAARAGCKYFLCERLPDGWDDDELMGTHPVTAIIVLDTVAAMNRLAAAYRETYLPHVKTVAITGSVGKTTTKECTAAVLGEGLSVFKKDGNFNSTIGLPLTVTEISPDYDAAVLEMGMSGRGEIYTMSTSVCPDIAVIANVGSSHLEHLGTRENIARAKLEIMAGLRSGGTLLINGDEPLLAHLGQDFEGEKPTLREDINVLRLSLGQNPDADFVATVKGQRDGGMIFDLTVRASAGIYDRDTTLIDLWVPAMGEHMVWAGGFSVATGLLCGLDEDEARRGLSQYRSADMRQSVRSVSGVSIIEDCYNAAPESMRAALGVLDMTAAVDGNPALRRRVAVLGDMRELGEQSVALHRSVGAEVARRGVNLLVTAGALGAEIAAGAIAAGMNPDCVRVCGGTDTYGEAAEWLSDCLRTGDTVLFKASRAMTLEKLAADVAERLS